MGFFECLERWYKDFDECADEIIAKIDKVSKDLFCIDNVMLDITCDEEGYRKTVKAMPILFDAFYPAMGPKEEPKLKLKSTKQGLKNSAQIQYVACGGNFKDKGLSYTGVINVLKVILSYDYLWSEVRVKGGAYGCMNIISRNGDGCFVSYRDPNLKETIEAFENCADYIAEFDEDDMALTKYIISAIGNLDTPLTPAARGFNSLSAYMSGITDEMVQREREQVIDATVEDIRKCSELIRGFMEDHTLCVVGNAGKIEDNKELFDDTKTIFTV